MTDVLDPKLREALFPKLRPLMIEAMCGDPAAPPDCRKALENMIKNLK